ncbi:hypothetical protein D3C75_1387890 [compost metagenome]
MLNPAVDNGLPEGALFKWLGWDYLKSLDLYELKSHTQNVFMKAWKGRLPVANLAGGHH